MNRFLLLLTCVFSSFSGAFSQNALLKMATKAVVSEVADRGTDLRAQLDSVDFQFAISINEGAGFFDIEQKGETTSKLMYGLKETSEKTTVERLRDSLDIGVGMYNIRRYELAEYQIKKTVRQLEEEGLTDHLVYLRAISNLGLIALTQGRMEEAERHLSNSLEMAEENLGKRSMPYIANLNNKAKLLQLQGEYTESEKLFDEAFDHATDFMGAGMHVAIILNNKALLYQALGRNEQAIETMKKAIAESGKSPKKFLQGENSFDNRKFQANLATLYQLSGEYALAEALFLDLKKVFESKAQTKNAEFAALNNQLGILYYDMGQYDKAGQYLLTSINIYNKRFGESNIYFAKVAYDLGNYYLARNDMLNAEKWISKSFDIRKNILSELHPDYIRSEESLALLLWEKGSKSDAFARYKSAMDHTVGVIDRFFPAMSESEKGQFWSANSQRFQRFYSLALAYSAENESAIVDIFNYNLIAKGLLLNSTSRVRDAILSSGNQALIDLFLQWKDQKEQLAQAYTYSRAKLSAQKIDLAAMEQEANRLERMLSEQAEGFKQSYMTSKTTLADVQAVLKPQEAVVDIIRLSQPEAAYLAIIIKPAGKPEVVHLTDGQKLEGTHFSGYKNLIKYRMEDKLSFKNYWEAIDQKIAGLSRIYYSPDGVYHQLNINTLKSPAGKYILQLYDIAMVGNSRDLVEKRPAATVAKKQAFLLGFPDYGGTSIPALPGTLTEISEISTILSGVGFSLKKYTDKSATEESVKAVESARIVHIATHGFFQPDIAKSTESLFGNKVSSASDNPLLRSGLLFANVTQALADTTNYDVVGKDNGILTAFEAMNLDLTHTDLVVLSACETGLGELKAGEGVYGLQRAFSVAGAHNIIMSLWQVNDESSKVLMTRFYKYWASSGDIHLSFRKAQLDLISLYNHPYFWGAFVIDGV